MSYIPDCPPSPAKAARYKCSFCLLRIFFCLSMSHTYPLLSSFSSYPTYEKNEKKTKKMVQKYLVKTRADFFRRFSMQKQVQ